MSLSLSRAITPFAAYIVAYAIDIAPDGDGNPSFTAVVLVKQSFPQEDVSLMADACVLSMKQQMEAAIIDFMDTSGVDEMACTFACEVRRA